MARSPRAVNLEARLRASAPPPAARDEFPPGAAEPPGIPAETLSRRRFLTLLSASAALAVGGTSCSRIRRGKVVPYTKKPKETQPGVAAYYATTFPEGVDAYGVLVKTREGRPIHIEGNGEHPFSEGKAPLRAMADLLGLYDPDRLRQPFVDGSPASWTDAMGRVVTAVKDAAAAGKPVLIVTQAVLSPSRSALLEELKKAVPGLRHVAWEPVAPASEMAAARAAYGEWRSPVLRFDRADVVLSLQADFLGTDRCGTGGSCAAARRFSAKRRPGSPGDSMSRLWVLEGGMSLTGANADERAAVRPSKLAAIAFCLAKALHEEQGLALPAGMATEVLKGIELEATARQAGVEPARLRALAADLKRAGTAALVVAGPALPPEAHVAAHLLNTMLGSEGNTVDASLGIRVSLATAAEVEQATEEAAGGTAIFWGANPAHALPRAAAWRSAVDRIPRRIRIGLHMDETASACQVVLPEHHWLEAWGDHRVTEDVVGLQQPLVGNLYDTRQGEDVILELLRALGAQVPQDHATYLKARWERELYPAAGGSLATITVPPSAPDVPEKKVPAVSFEQFWSTAVHDGVRRIAAKAATRELRAEAVAVAAARAAAGSAVVPTDMEVVLVPSAGVHDGRYANNGWLEELPDPITKLTWGNAVAISAADADRLGVRDGDVLRVEAGGASVEAPALVQPGQAAGVLALALGHGRSAGSVASGIGSNAFPLVDGGSAAPYLRETAKVTATGNRVDLARTQEHNRMEGRDLVRSWSIAEYAAKIHGHEKEHEIHSLYPDQQFPDHKWGMAIDLSTCTGCSACVVACQSENNIPVVGPEQVIRSREMHWIRLDLYYEGDAADPHVLQQPILCQHCDNAPCESVCPVNATTHSPDGLNQMTYNRCVGTRYCANNCPYKVRRYNFFDYTATKQPPETLALNPEVSVRPRGVMEKCTFCIQRIQEVRMRAKADGRPIRDGEIRPACAVACPAEAIVFGDLKDPESAVSRMSRSDRGYKLLEELGIRPAVTYLARVTNPAGGAGPAAGSSGAAHEGGKS